MKDTPKGRPAKKPERKYKKITISMPPDLEKMLRDKAYETGRSASEIVSECVRLDLVESVAEKKSVRMITPLESPKVKKKNARV